MEYQISMLNHTNTEIATRIQTLLNQLDVKANAGVTQQTLSELINNKHSALFVAVKNDVIYGVLTISAMNIANGLVAWIEALVIDEPHRGRGIGRALIEAALKQAKDWECLHVSLTAQPKRQDATHLYLDMGFVKDDTYFYEHPL